MKRVLLHICCGPCAITPVRDLQEEGVEVVGFYFNPNIHPLQEYLRRRDGAMEAADRLGIKLICKDEEHDPGEYLRAVAFRENNRCFLCYSMRLERTRSIARRGRFDAFSSTLLYSRFQKHEQIMILGRDLAGQGSPAFLYRDFRSGWKHGIEISKEWGIYRQQYCGCIYSEFERYQNDLRREC